jgi:glutaredoxin
MMTILRRISRRKRPARLDDLTVTVYTRDRCCCCHKAVEVLERYRTKHHFSIHEVDVDSDPALAEAHGSSVPVVAIGGKVRFRGVVNPVLLERLLLAASSPSST